MNTPAPIRGDWRWQPDQDALLFRRRHVDGARFKEIAFEFGRGETAVHNRFHELQRRLEKTYGDVLAKHRREEAELLKKMLCEERMPGPEERE